jgi:NAD-dependent dihydropyrimidine dehydrogenase PreA subunit
MGNKAYIIPNPMTPNQCVIINSELCTGCNACVDACRTDVLIPNPQKGKPPILLYPDECWFGGCCVADCPVPGAITMQISTHQKVGWKRKDSGEFFRLGMKNPPPPNDRPPIG